MPKQITPITKKALNVYRDHFTIDKLVYLESILKEIRPSLIIDFCCGSGTNLVKERFYDGSSLLGPEYTNCYIGMDIDSNQLKTLKDLLRRRELLDKSILICTKFQCSAKVIKNLFQLIRNAFIIIDPDKSTDLVNNIIERKYLVNIINESKYCFFNCPIPPIYRDKIKLKKSFNGRFRFPYNNKEHGDDMLQAIRESKPNKLIVLQKTKYFWLIYKEREE